MPRSQIDTARLDSAKGHINISGPLDFEPGLAVTTLFIHVTVIYGGAHAHGFGTETRAGAGQGRWLARAETVGTFEVGKMMEAFGIVVTAESDAVGGRRVHQMFTWSERVKLDAQL